MWERLVGSCRNSDKNDFVVGFHLHVGVEEKAHFCSFKGVNSFQLIKHGCIEEEMISGTFKCTVLKGNILCSSFMQSDIDCKKPKQSKHPQISVSF